MSLPLPDAFDYRGRTYSLEGSQGTGLPKHPGWSAYRQTYGLWEGRLVVRQIALHLPAGEAPPSIDGVTPRAGEGWGGRAWVYDLRRPTRFEGWLLIGDLNLRGDRLAAMPVPWVGHGGTHFELGFVDGALLEETELTEEVARLFSAEVGMKRARVHAPELVSLLDRLEERYGIRPF